MRNFNFKDDDNYFDFNVIKNNIKKSVVLPLCIFI